jgi:drug/metabolite transporter (DMT)-like permease
MFIGEFLCMGAYYFQKWRARNKYGGKESPGFLNTSLKTDFNKALFAIPALFDVGASTLMFFALTGCAASVYQMMRGIIAVITGLMSVIFLKRKLYRHHWTGLILITLGCAIVGVVALLWGKFSK